MKPTFVQIKLPIVSGLFLKPEKKKRSSLKQVVTPTAVSTWVYYKNDTYHKTETHRETHPWLYLVSRNVSSWSPFSFHCPLLFAARCTGRRRRRICCSCSNRLIICRSSNSNLLPAIVRTSYDIISLKKKVVIGVQMFRQWVVVPSLEPHFKNVRFWFLACRLYQNRKLKVREFCVNGACTYICLS